MTGKFLVPIVTLLTLIIFGNEANAQPAAMPGPLTLRTRAATVTLDEFYFVSTSGRTSFSSAAVARALRAGPVGTRLKLADGRVVKLVVTQTGANFAVEFSAQPNSDIIKWGLAVAASSNEYFTGLMERVVDGPQQASWRPGIAEAMNLRGQKVEMIVKPTTAIYAPFYLSSNGYAVFVKGDWPGMFDFCVDDPARVKIEFEGPAFALKFYTATDPASLVRAHALDAGPPVLVPKWTFTPWRWRDEHKHLPTYYDGTPVTGPFNSQVMEDVLMMKAYGIPNGVYWIDRPWGPGALGYDDFEIDEQRLPAFALMVKWLESLQAKTVLWIGPFYQGNMAREALAKGYTVAGQERPANGNNYPLVDYTNPAAKQYWQDGLAKLLKLGVAGFKLDRSEENIPESGPHKVFDGRSVRAQRNAYPVMYTQATYETAKKYRGDDFVLMPRAAYTGSSAYAAFWGGDIGGTQEGLRASIIAVQRAAVMGYPTWGSDTCGYNQQQMELEVCGRWLGFSAFTPIMEVGPTRNLAFWSLPRSPSYDTELIAIWRLYARLHQRLVDYSYTYAREAHKTGMPIVRPLFLVDQSQAARANWWTYLYGPNILVSPIWEKDKRTQEVYLPVGSKWRDVWHPDKVFAGGQTITVQAELHQIPIFTREGARIDLGDLNREWQEAHAIAEKRPELKALETEVKSWFDKHK